MHLEGKICVITGASSGIGKRLARDLAAQGAVVCAAARREDRLKELVGGLPAVAGGAHTYVVTDVSERDQVHRLAEHVSATYGRCDVLVNNAGISGGRVFDGEEALDTLEKVFRTNFFGAAYCTASFLPLLESSAPSHVVNIASIAGRVAFGNGAAYCGSKFALVGWSEALYYDLKPKDIHVSLVEPGPIPTEGFPQTALIESPVLRRALAGSGDVSRAVQGVIKSKKMQRAVPRYYYLASVLRLLAPPLFRFAAKRLASPNATAASSGPGSPSDD
ncbi:MAG: uncharacterized protein QOH26_1480 [Actinomycetota bacterium]|nr:uncharacterized protein [Actinomycetota bacterium]